MINECREVSGVAESAVSSVRRYHSGPPRTRTGVLLYDCDVPSKSDSLSSSQDKRRWIVIYERRVNVRERWWLTWLDSVCENKECASRAAANEGIVERRMRAMRWNGATHACGSCGARCKQWHAVAVWREDGVL